MKSHAYIAILMLFASAASAQDTQTLPGVLAQAETTKAINRGCLSHSGGHFLSTREVANALAREPSAEMDTLRVNANKDARALCRQDNVAVEFRFVRGTDAQPIAIVTRGARLANAL